MRSETVPAPAGVDFRRVSADEVARHMDELIALYREVYAEPPYEWGVEQSELFSDPFARQRRSAGFSLVEARCGDQLVAYGFGVPLAPTTTWWQRLDTPLPEALTREYPGRTFALVELLVRRPWRRKHVAETLHARLLQERQEERATLLALPAADAAQAAYAKWGWCKVAQKRNPVPGSPVFDVMVKELGNLRHLRCAPAGP